MKVLVDLGLISAIFIAAAVLNIIIIGLLVFEISFKKHQVKSLEIENADLRVQLSKIKENPFEREVIKVEKRLKHMILCHVVSKREIIECQLPELLHKTIVNELADQMREVIEQNMETRDDYTEDVVKYYCDVWVK